MRRILALWLPRFSTDRLKRKDASLCDASPLVIAGRANNALYVQALDERAQKLGLYKGQPLANARAMVPALTIRPAEDNKDRALLEQIADWCDRFSPFVATAPRDGLLIDITGAAHLFGGEAAMLNHVSGKIAGQGFAVQAAIAGTAPAAQALARFAPNHIAAPGTEEQALARLPVAALAADEKIIAALRRAGLKTIEQVVARQRDELAARFGKPFVTGLEILLGHHDQPINPLRPLPDLMAEQRFAEPIVTQDAISASLLSLAQSLSDILEQRGLGLRRLEASFFRADGQVRRLCIALGSAARDPGQVLRLLREKLDALTDPLDPGFGFDVIRLEAMLTERAVAAQSGLDSHEYAAREIDHLVDQLAARHGEARVLRFVPQDTHVPEYRCAPVPAQDKDFPPEPWAARRGPGDPPLRPLRLFEKPEEITAIAGLPDDPPKQFRWRRARFEVARAEGPERIAMHWWRQEKPTRDYFRVETSEGQRFWLYRDWIQGSSRWYLHGIFA
jgi:protein ImuB